MTPRHASARPMADVGLPYLATKRALRGLHVKHRGEHPGHDVDCAVRLRPEVDYELGNPDSEQHCSRCHCTCDPDGPGCGHWAGCPGC